MKADLREIARYLGYGNALPGPDVLERISFCCEKLEEISPRYVSRMLPLEALPFGSTDLAAHLRGCSQVILFAATLGAEADLLLRRWTASDLSLAVVGQACAAALLEGYCDGCMETLSHPLGEGQYLRPRFSPGYGDFSLSHQKTILDLLDAGRRIGLSLTTGNMLVPSKSVTAVIGVTQNPDSCTVSKCTRCGSTHCPFRKE